MFPNTSDFALFFPTQDMVDAEFRAGYLVIDMVTTEALKARFAVPRDVVMKALTKEVVERH